jgi:hypothetical protein
MKNNWKVLVAIVIMVGVVVWAVSSVIPRSFDGSNLTFGVGSGTVTVNNTSDETAAVQLVGNGSRGFTVSSNIEGVTGASTRQGSGNASTQLFEYGLPPGTSEFSVTRGNGVNFVSASDTRLEATAKPLSASETTTTLVVAAVVILAGSYFISRSVDHRWIKTLLRREAPVPVAVASLVTPPVGDPNRGRDGRMYSNYGGKD